MIVSFFVIVTWLRAVAIRVVSRVAWFLYWWLGFNTVVPHGDTFKEGSPSSVMLHLLFLFTCYIVYSDMLNSTLISIPCFLSVSLSSSPSVSCSSQFTEYVSPWSDRSIRGITGLRVLSGQLTDGRKFYDLIRSLALVNDSTEHGL